MLRLEGKAHYNFRCPACRYLWLSMVSKTSLHLIIGLTVIGQGSTLNVDGDGSQRSSMDTFLIGFLGSLGIAVVLGFVVRFIVKA